MSSSSMMVPSRRSWLSCNFVYLRCLWFRFSSHLGLAPIIIIITNWRRVYKPANKHVQNGALKSTHKHTHTSVEWDVGGFLGVLEEDVLFSCGACNWSHWIHLFVSVAVAIAVAVSVSCLLVHASESGLGAICLVRRVLVSRAHCCAVSLFPTRRRHLLLFPPFGLCPLERY